MEVVIADVELKQRGPQPCLGSFGHGPPRPDLASGILRVTFDQNENSAGQMRRLLTCLWDGNGHEIRSVDEVCRS